VGRVVGFNGDQDLVDYAHQKPAARERGFFVRKDDWETPYNADSCRNVEVVYGTRGEPTLSSRGLAALRDPGGGYLLSGLFFSRHSKVRCRSQNPRGDEQASNNHPGNM